MHDIAKPLKKFPIRVYIYRNRFLSNTQVKEKARLPSPSRLSGEEKEPGPHSD
jgi:ribosomal protein L10